MRTQVFPLSLYLVFWLYPLRTFGIPIDNDLADEPEIFCGPETIKLDFSARNNFEGHVYVKGLYREESCRSERIQGREGTIELPFDSCNVRRLRSLSPRGVFVTSTVIISFHPQFITKVDKVFKIQCFYMEADKTVSEDLSVSMLTTEFAEQNILMPVCTYEILRDKASTEIVKYTTISEGTYHKWECKSDNLNQLFCMTVHSCYVESAGQKVDLITAEGCGIDKYIMNTPEYEEALLAGIEVHAFKFKETPDLYFQCQISIFVREFGPDGEPLECPRPDCPILGGNGAGDRYRTTAIPLRGKPPVFRFPLQPPSPYLAESENRLSRRRRSTLGTIDVATDVDSTPITTLENSTSLYHHHDPRLAQGEISSLQFCVTPAALATGLGGLVLAAIICLILIAHFHLRRKDRSKHAPRAS